MLLEHEQNCGLDMDAPLTRALGTRAESWFGHGCSGNRMLLEHNGIMVWAWMLLEHKRNGDRMLLETETKSWFGMDALATLCFWNTNEIMAWPWMLW